MFQEPDLVGGPGVPLQSEALHGLPGGYVLHPAEMLDDGSFGHGHRAMSTRSWALRSRYKASSCSRLWALMVTVIDTKRPSRLGCLVTGSSVRGATWRARISSTT